MIPIWIIITIFVTVLYAASSIIQKYVLKGDFGSLTYVMLISLMNLVYATVTLLIIPNFSASLLNLALGIISGILGALSSILILHSIKHDEVSRVIPLMATTPIFVAIFAAFLINETFTPLIYLAIIAMFIGSFLLSFKFGTGFPKKIKSLELVILSNIIFAIATVIVKFVLSNGLDYKIYLFCGFFGFFLGTVPLWFSKKFRHNFSTNYKIFSNLKLVLLSESFALIAFLLVSYATLIGPISLITSLKSLNILFVCLFAFAIGKFRPKIMKEEFEGRGLWTKIIAIILLLVGTFVMIG